MPVVRNGERDGAVRITQSVAAVDRAFWSATVGLVLVGLIAWPLDRWGARIYLRGLRDHQA